MTPEPRLAATVLALREAGAGALGGLEVLMLRRHSRSGFAASLWVFPGGTVDEADRCLHPDRWSGVDPQALGAVLGWDGETALGLAVAAVRETFEECGLLIARHGDGAAVDLSAPAIVRMRHAEVERAAPGLGAGGATDVGARGPDWHAWLGEAGIVLDLGTLTPWSRWITPVQEPRRYDTAFFLAVAPAGQVADHDRVETTDSRWLAPAEALARHDRGELPMMFPTIVTLRELAGHDSVESAVAAARAVERLPAVRPHVVLDDDGRVVDLLHPDDPAFPREAQR